MNRIVEAEIAGKKADLNFSMLTVMRLEERYGDLGGFFDAFTGSAAGTGGTFQAVCFALALMSQHGAARRKLYGEPEAETFTEEQLETLLSPADCADMMELVNRCINAGSAVTVETEKNGEAAPAER